MTPDERDFIIKKISYAIGMSNSIKPERMAVAVMEELETFCSIELKRNKNASHT